MELCFAVLRTRNFIYFLSMNSRGAGIQHEPKCYGGTQPPCPVSTRVEVLLRVQIISASSGKLVATQVLGSCTPTSAEAGNPFPTICHPTDTPV